MRVMINAGFVDFLFTGHPGPALLLFIPLLIAACLVSMYREQTAATEKDATGVPPPGKSS